MQFKEMLRNQTSWGRAGPSSVQVWLQLLSEILEKSMMKTLRFETSRQSEHISNLSFIIC